MAATGEICKVCESPVVSEVEAVACVHCQTVSHTACLESVQQVCPVCGQFYHQPSPAAAHDSPLNFVEGELQRPPTTAWYRFSLVVVSLAMILLPLIYAGLVALSFCAVVYYALHFDSMLQMASYGLTGLIGVCLFYFGPLFAGGTLTFFLIKPIFAPKPEAKETVSLNHADAPQLFALVGWICRSLDAPIPSRIDVDSRVNASATLRSVFGNDIVLTIGLPLVAGMDLSQFTGVIAHEYGHFSQGLAMRASYVIGRINGWFYRTVYERDKWDMELEAASEAETRHSFGLVFIAVLYLARLTVWLTRRVLWLFMAAGSALSCFMMRQMEFDADLYEIRMSGSEVFITSMQRVRQLNLGYNSAVQQIRDKWKKERKLFDRLPDFIASRADEIPADAQEKLHTALARRRTRVFDMHPSDAERIERARAAREPGIFHPTAPASSLFADFPELSRRVSVNYYQSIFGPRFKDELLISTEATRALTEHDYEADRENIRRYFLGVASDFRPVIIKENKAPIVRQQETLVAEILAYRRQMEESLPAAQAALAEYVESDIRFLYAGEAAQLMGAGFHFDPADFALADNETLLAQADAIAAMQAADAILQPFEAAGKARLTDTVQLLRLPAVAALVPDAVKLQDEARQMIWVLSRLENSFAPLQELRRDCDTLEILLQYRRDQPVADNVTPVLESLCTGIQDRVNTLQEQTAQMRYPFHHATEEVMVNAYARNKEYHADPFELALREGRSHVEKLSDLYCRLLGKLVVICETVESAVISTS
jgi:Zn-dependent protease with chaperone function